LRRGGGATIRHQEIPPLDALRLTPPTTRHKHPTRPSGLGPTIRGVSEDSSLKTLFWVQVGAAVLAGVILYLLKELTGKSTAWVLIYIGVPLAAFLMVGGAVLGVRSIRRTRKARRAWEGSVEATLIGLACAVRRTRLHELIHAVQVWGWKVYDHGSDLVFESPDGDSEVVTELAPDPHGIAQRLQNLDPNHFKADPWKPVAHVADVEAAKAQNEAANLGKQLAVLENRIDDVARGFPNLQMELMKVRLADVINEARDEGWIAEWGKQQVVFSRDDDTATVTDTATVPYGEASQVDTRKLRALLSRPDQRGASRQTQ
jgi:hypothetical protein